MPCSSASSQPPRPNRTHPQYGYARLWASNASHFHFEHVQVLVSPSRVWPEVVDIVQPHHGPFAYPTA